MKRYTAVLTLLSTVCLLSLGAYAQPQPLTKPAIADPYLDLAVTYCIHAKTLWHQGDVGGYWGGGINEPDGNGAVRGMCNTMLGYALLAHADKQQWLTKVQRDELTSAGLGRQELVGYVRSNLTFITSHHTSSPKALKPLWGQSWQSPLWLGAAVVAVHLVWEDIPAEQQQALALVAGTEADRLAATPPGDYRPGDTKAEENGWNMLALAGALAMNPHAPAADSWWRALRSYAANTYSMKADQTSSATVGTDRVCDIVRTANLFDDFTLDNHGFFHPDYVQVSGQHLGEAWEILALGDRRFQGDYARRFEPYALHHVADVWKNVMRPLMLPNGEFVFPNGNDWTFHCSMNQAYLAWIATGVGDPVAVLAEQRAIQPALDRRKVSPGGCILGDSNLPWWWEPLLVKRCTSALLLHALRPTPKTGSKTALELEGGITTKLFPVSKVWLHRNANYVVTLAWGKRHMATFTPTGPDLLKHPYTTLPIDDGVLSEGVSSIRELPTTHGVHAVCMQLKDGRAAYAVCMPRSVLWLSPGALGALGVENDKLSGGHRVVACADNKQQFDALTSQPTLALGGTWMSIDKALGFVGLKQGFVYEPAGKFNRRSAAVDRVTPLGSWGLWQMLPGAGADELNALSGYLHADYSAGSAHVQTRDGAQGPLFRFKALLDGRAAKQQKFSPVLEIQAQD